MFIKTAASYTLIALTRLANCHYVVHQSDRQGPNAPKGYIVRQEMTPEIAHIHVGRLQNGMIWMQINLSPHRLHTVFLVPILICVERQSIQLLASLYLSPDSF